MTMKGTHMKSLNVGLVLALLAMQPVFATSHQEASSVAASAVTEGEVRKVDKDAKKITLKHDAIKNLDMPPMTMVFVVKDPAMLDQVKQGDKVRFTADKVAGVFTLVTIETAK